MFPPRPANEKRVGNSMVFFFAGRDYTFALYISFDDQRWTRNDGRESRHFGRFIYEYSGPDDNAILRDE